MKMGSLIGRALLDLHSPTWATDRDRLLALGATPVGEYREYGQHWVTLCDLTRCPPGP